MFFKEKKYSCSLKKIFVPFVLPLSDNYLFPCHKLFQSCVKLSDIKIHGHWLKIHDIPA